jgi:hypothetical protein
MRTHNKMMIAVGAFALTATTVLAGCGGSSTASTPAAEPAAASSPAAEPAAAESAAAEVPTSVADGLVRPAGVSDRDWGEFTQLDTLDEALKTWTPDEVSEICAMDKDELRSAIGYDDSNNVLILIGGTDEEWSAAIAKIGDNTQRIACSLAK